MMYGIDVSNWQTGIVPSELDIDFCIVKATEGIGYVDPNCDRVIQDCISNNLLWGFYHFARENEPEDEAKFFYDSCKNYIGYGIPVLDYETKNPNDVNWCERFARKFFTLSGVWPIMYLCAGQLPMFKSAGTWLPERCGLWLAGYPYPATTWNNDAIPYQIDPWPFVAIWQFTSSLIIPGWHAKLDGNKAYMDADGWSKYANATKEEQRENQSHPEKTIDDLAHEVILGEYGIGEDRKRLLGARYESVQNRINELYNIADEVCAGKWGNGWNRKQALNGAGYPYETVQLIVNEMMKNRS